MVVIVDKLLKTKCFPKLKDLTKRTQLLELPHHNHNLNIFLYKSTKMLIYIFDWFFIILKFNGKSIMIGTSIYLYFLNVVTHNPTERYSIAHISFLSVFLCR